MNLFICTVKIIATPRLFFHKKRALVSIKACITNNKKQLPYYYVAAKARGKLAHRIFNTYNLGDTAIIQGNISIKSKKVELLEISKNLKMKKFINIKINKIYNVKKDL